jgi:CRP-like cAMP-binding protein
MRKVDKDKLCELLDNGISNKAQLARELGCTRQYVHQLITTYSYEYKGGGKVQRSIDKILSLRQQHKTYKQIANELGFCIASVANILTKIRKERN